VGVLLQWLCVAALTLVATASNARAELRERAVARASGAFLRAATKTALPRRRSATDLGPATAQVRQAPSSSELANRRALRPDVLRRVLGARLQLAPEVEPVAELDESWVSLEPPPKRPFRPKYMLDVMSFPTGGSGIKLKVRY